jgi:hypothetical protein
MATAKTLFTPEQQWRRTAQYLCSQPGWETVQDSYHRSPKVWIVTAPHRLLCVGDVLVATFTNGMDSRYAMSGVSSKGVRLDYCYIALRCMEEAELPGDLINLRWDDPAVGRFVADLRASSRRRVGTCIPAPKQPRVLSHTLSLEGAPPLQFEGCYRSRREPRHKRREFFRRNYLRFFPDGTVIASPNGGFSAANRQDFLKGPWGTAGKFSVEGDTLSVAIFHDGEVVERYKGKIDGVYLRLARQCRNGWAVSREDDVYTFGAWRAG